ncbi:MAG: M48 family metalloprotease [Leptospiraceae bacterium]|nr:M48 family metalloprotease [Leptospiraceae bacterium]MCP5498541.1 M48 family metalloprotease [Leptospiraceae bacterium]
MNYKEKALHELEVVLADWNSTPIGRKHFLASVPLLLSACSSGDKKRYREGDNTGQYTDITVEDEKNMAQEYLPKMLEDYPPVQDNDMQEYISGIGQRIVRANGLHGKPYEYNFMVVGTKNVNAFALPAGTIFVTAPLIAMADSEAELAGVIGHEIGHVKARHTAERIYEADQMTTKMWKNIATGSGIGALIGGAAGAATACKGKKGNDFNKCVAAAAAAGAAVGIAAGYLITKYQFMQNSQEDELEADRIGFRTAVNAGYSKAYVGKFYEKLLQMESQAKAHKNPITSSLADAMSTHPPSTKRVGEMNKLVAESNKSGGAVSSSAFEKFSSKARRL